MGCGLMLLRQPQLDNIQLSRIKMITENKHIVSFEVAMIAKLDLHSDALASMQGSLTS